MSKLSVYALVILAAGAAACGKDDVQPISNTDGKTPLVLTSTINQTRTVTTGLQTTQLVKDVKIGVFVLNEDASILEGAENLPLTADGAGNFSGETIYFPNEGSVSVFAYAPYSPSWNFGVNTFSVSKDQSTEQGYLDSDLLYGIPQDENSFDKSYGKPIALLHTHLLSKVTLKFDVSEYVDFSNASLYITNVLPTTNVDLTNGNITAATGSSSNIKVAQRAEHDDVVSGVSAVVVPQSLKAGTSFVQVVFEDRSINAKLNTDITFAGGKSYTYTIKIMGDAAEIVASNFVTDWTDTDVIIIDEFEEVDAPEQPDNSGEEEKNDEPDNNGGSAVEGDTVTATFQTPGGNASYDAPTYTWTANNNNLMTIFEFKNGELANYKTLTIKFSNISDGAAVRFGYYIGNTYTGFNNGGGYYSNGTKTIDLTSLGIDLSQVDKISFGGYSNSGSVDIIASECTISK